MLCDFNILLSMYLYFFFGLCIDFMYFISMDYKYFLGGWGGRGFDEILSLFGGGGWGNGV